jgi:DNA-binding Xre family transcriptional regulator
MSEIGVQLGRLRIARHLTQQQLADQVGVRRDTISSLERGKSRGIEFSTLARLCDALACTPNDLLELSPNPHVAPVLGGEDEDAIVTERLRYGQRVIVAVSPGPAVWRSAQGLGVAGPRAFGYDLDPTAIDGGARP